MERRRYTLMIDCESDGFRKGVRFWSAALGAPARHSGDPTDPFIELPAAMGDVHIEVQRVDAPSRYHLDLFAPDVDKEAGRLEALGAQKVKREESWWVMQAPTGHIFCVIPESAPLPDGGFDGGELDEDFDDDDLDDDFDDEDDEDFEDDEDDEDFEDELDDEEDEEDLDEEPEPPRKHPYLRAVPNDPQGGGRSAQPTPGGRPDRRFDR